MEWADSMIGWRLAPSAFHVGVLGTLLAASIGAQTTLGVFQAGHEYSGTAAAGAGDVNQDGIPDVVVGHESASPGGFSEGSAFVYSGKDGSKLWQFDGIFPDDGLGSSVSGAGDVNKDGFADVIVGAELADSGVTKIDAGSAFVYSGKDGTLLWRFDGHRSYDYFGFSVSGAGDVNKDGFDDVIVGAPYADFGYELSGSAYVYSGKDGTLLWVFDGEAAGVWLGYSVAGAGDIDRDGFSDVIVGAPRTDSRGSLRAGVALVYSGRSGKLLLSLEGAPGQLGSSVACAGDVDLDGIDDLIVGAPWTSVGENGRAGSAYVFSGSDGAILWRFDGREVLESLGWSVDSAGDVDGDGFLDLIVGAYDDSVFVYSGEDGELLWEFTSSREPAPPLGGLLSFFYNVGAGVGDLNQDGFADAVMVTRDSVTVYHFDPALVTFGAGIPGSAGITPRLHTSGTFPRVGNSNFKIRLDEAASKAPFLIAASLAQAQTPFEGMTMYGDFFSPGMFSTWGSVTYGVSGVPGWGFFSLTVPVPNDPSLLGLTTYWQGFVLDPGSPLPIGVSHTQGLEVRVVR